MTVIDIHTHMLSEEYLRRLTEHSDGVYTLGEAAGGHRSIYRAGAPFLTLTQPMFDYRLRIKDMDAAGVDIAVVSLSCPSVYWGTPEVSATVAALMNDQMAGAQAEYPGRIRFLASLPWEHPDAAVAELERAIGLGAVGVMVLANVAGAALTEERFAPVWQAIDRHKLPVLVHPGTPPGLEQLGMDRYHLVWSVGFTFDTTLALARMILDGFFDRYQNLKIIGAHAGGYLPFLLPRLDQGFRSFDAVRESITAPPSSYAPRLYVDSIVYSTLARDFSLAAFGPRNVLYGSDYPHKCGRMDEMLDMLDGLPASDRAAITAGNAERLFTL